MTSGKNPSNKASIKEETECFSIISPHTLETGRIPIEGKFFKDVGGESYIQGLTRSGCDIPMCNCSGGYI